MDLKFVRMPQGRTASGPAEPDPRRSLGFVWLRRRGCIFSAKGH